MKKAIQLYNTTPQSDDDENGWSISEMVADERMVGPDEELLNSDNVVHVYRMLDEMDEREASILKMRFGLDGEEPRTLKEIGETLGLTRERVRQLEHEALKRLNKGLMGN